MSTQATLQTPDEVLESPVAPPVARGLVPRSGLTVALLIFVLILFGFAFYDLVLRKPAQVNESAETKKASKMAVDSLGKSPNLADIATMAEQQAAKVPTATAPLPAASMSAKVGAPSDAPQSSRGIPADGPLQEDQRAAQSATSPIFSLTGSEGGSGGVPGVASAGNQLVGAAAEQFANLQRSVEQRAASATAGGGEGAEMVKALALAQGQQGNRIGKDQQFMKELAGGSSAEATFAKGPAYPWLVFQGTRLPIVVREAINSDLPGSITGITTSPVYDSINQCAVLVPSGTRVIGTYSADIRPGQSRVLMGFSRMIFPDGRSLDLNGAQGVDQIGAVGQEGDVNNHFLKMFGYSFAIALLADNMTNRGASSLTVGQNGQSTTTTIAGQVLGQISSGILSRNASIPPTINLDVGSRLFITLVRDLALPPISRTRCK